ncbi:SBBP repeat-containing protein [Myxococcus stipitatus]|uniref:SBBP repeat-containing protein n=1 Tax=Myxococcus stipitatus TaxID=83455 RepID=UPI0030CB1B1B
MRLLNAVRGGFLAGALALLGCQGEEPAVAESSDEGRVTQEVTSTTCFNTVPVMTGNTTPTGIVTSSGIFDDMSDYAPWKAFDSSYTFWLSPRGQTPAWLAYEFGGGKKVEVTSYAIQYANGSITSRAPKDWKLEGWNGTAWVVVDTRSNQTNWAGNERREFTVASPGSYLKYRLLATDDNDSRAGIVTLSIGGLELFGCLSYDATPSAWTRLMGAANGISYVNDMTGDPAGRAYTTGVTSVGLGGLAMVGTTDSFLTMHFPDGSRVFHRQIGAPGAMTVGNGVARNKRFEEIYVAGYTNGSIQGTPSSGGRDAFITRYRYTGVWGWTRQLGVAGAQTEANGVSVDASDNAFIAGTTTGNLDGNTRVGLMDGFVAKYDAAGNRLWTRQFGAPQGMVRPTRATADSAGNVYVSGYTNAGLDGVARTGTQDAFIIKYDGSGVKQWTRMLGVANTDTWLDGAMLDAAENVYVTGFGAGGLDGLPNVTVGRKPYLVKFNSAGVKQWVWELDTGAGAWARNGYADSDGIYLTGSAWGDVTSVTNTMASAAHAFVAKVDFNGTLQFIKQQAPAMYYEEARAVNATGIIVNMSGEVLLGGMVEGEGYLDGQVMKGKWDVFVSKIAL